MATVTVRGLGDEVRHALKIRAAANNRSMEAEIRAILTAVVTDLEEAPRPSTGTASRAEPPVLSQRQERVAGLVAEGLTNRQIAALLYVSERTVESHVSSILRKLGCQRRSTVASWYAARPGDPDRTRTVLPRMPGPSARH